MIPLASAPGDAPGARRGIVGEALGRVLGRPRLVLALTALHAATALGASIPVALALAPLLDLRPAASTMLAGDDALALELLVDHPELVREAVATFAIAVALYGLLSWIVAGGVLAALAVDEDRRARGLRAILEQAGRRAGQMIRIGGVGLLTRIVPLGLAVGSVALLTLRIEHDASLSAQLVHLGATAALFAILWSFSSVAIDLARGAGFADPHLGAWRAVGRGLRLAFGRRRGAALRLVAYSTLGFGALTVGYHVLAPGGATWLAVTTLWLLRLVIASGRVTVTATTLVAAALVAAEADPLQ